MITHILAVDGGGTKTAMRLKLILPTLSVIEECILPATSLSLYGETAITQLTHYIEEMLSVNQIKAKQCYIVVGVAGAGNSHLKAKLKSALAHCPHLYVTTDAEASVFGANAGQGVNCIAIGTGSVAIQLDNQHVTHQFGGWGFPIGDQGGGAWLGFRAVQQTLAEFDDKRSSLTSQLVMNKIGSERSDILKWLNTANATDYAQFARELVDIEQRCSTASTILKQGIEEIEKLTRTCSENNSLPIMFLGSLGQFYRSKLSQGLQARALDIQGNAQDGAEVIAHQKIHMLNLGNEQ
ncbi:BadF/BadG/BcrA/BcrD ATPase family protein [Vibrio kanaloae]|uniref:BadF/BadG/BcrA/BcrD ATPase family protein n=1 Tax=Vibrio kanaloae TaxID=170673 RepID=UPI0010BD580E|nr:BadF/BadG/BcrA/BcrD ATPase family protein [Vibrio kanaloae]TKF04108.1 ATPase [Vibrio kanaloae]TKF63106.1 ATPase [Vibrio kanaloae]TKF81867.1 ATPase [Vibrio kanaloae]UIJ40312.1 ATPase [Vibrio kanaloae]